MHLISTNRTQRRHDPYPEMNRYAFENLSGKFVTDIPYIRSHAEIFACWEFGAFDCVELI